MNQKKASTALRAKALLSLLASTCFSAKGFISSKRGFLFTISVIFFASTLVVYSQAYMTQNALREKLVLTVPRQTLPAYLTDDLAFDLQRLLDFNLSVSETASPYKMNIVLGDSVAKNFDIRKGLTDYNNFAKSYLLNRVAGIQSFDMNNLLDGKTELFFGNLFRYDYDYDNNAAYFLALKDNNLNRVDLNITVKNSNGSDDLNSMIWSSPGSGSTQLRVHYVDDTNTFDLAVGINPLQTSTMTLHYMDANLQVVFGLAGGRTNSVLIDSNINRQANYLLGLTYDANAVSLPVFFNATLRHTDGKLDSNTWLKLMN